MDVDLGPTRPPIREQQKGASDQERARLDGPQRTIWRREQNCLALNVQTRAENDDQREHDELDPPSHRADRRSKRLFKIDQDEHCRNKKKRIECLGDRSWLNRRAARIASGHALEQLIVERNRESDGNETDDDERDRPTRQELAVV